MMDSNGEANPDRKLNSLDAHVLPSKQVKGDPTKSNAPRCQPDSAQSTEYWPMLITASFEIAREPCGDVEVP